MEKPEPHFKKSYLKKVKDLINRSKDELSNTPVKQNKKNEDLVLKEMTRNVVETSIRTKADNLLNNLEDREDLKNRMSEAVGGLFDEIGYLEAQF